MKDIVALSNRNRILIFRSEFPVLPRKISEYLRTELSSGANTRIMRDFHKVLNTNSLRLRGSFSHCKKHHFGLRNRPYCILIWALSDCEMGNIGKQKRLFRTMLWGISKDDLGRDRLYNGGVNIPLHLFSEFILSK